jgi:hypothetical protein
MQKSRFMIGRASITLLETQKVIEALLSLKKTSKYVEQLSKGECKGT